MNNQTMLRCTGGEVHKAQSIRTEVGKQKKHFLRHIKVTWIAWLLFLGVLEGCLEKHHWSEGSDSCTLQHSQLRPIPLSTSSKGTDLFTQVWLNLSLPKTWLKQL